MTDDNAPGFRESGFEVGSDANKIAGRCRGKLQPLFAPY
jgi:hypothetical protein